MGRRLDRPRERPGIRKSIGQRMAEDERWVLLPIFALLRHLSVDIVAVTTLKWMQTRQRWVEAPMLKTSLKSLVLTALLVSATLVFAEILVVAGLILITMSVLALSLAEPLSRFERSPVGGNPPEANGG